jgi:polyhydroxybutyrate depolymerase
MFKRDRRTPSLSAYLFTGLTLFLVTFMSACIPPAPVSTPTSIPTETTAPTAIPTAVPTLQAGDNQYVVTVNGMERTYLLHIPPGLDTGKPLPIVFAFPGYDIEVHFEISDMQYMTGYNDISDKSGFLLVYPSGVSGTWNTGTCCGAALDQKVDEAAFIHQMITDIGKIAPIDPKRIYAVGYSLGAMMSYRAACEMSDTFAAVAPVAGGLTFSPCEPAQPVSILQIHGMKDNLVPYQGGIGGFMGGKTTFPAVQDTISSWAKLDGCTGSPQVEKQGTIGTHTIYATCKDGSAVELYVIDGLGNNWPSQYVLPASQLIWDFFQAHPKP